jgi:uncharacterized protein with von Willebrand factor type A (vWA) domain
MDSRLGGVIHTYQKYDPKEVPSPTQPPPDVVSPLFEHMLYYGNMRELTEEELARAIRIDPSQFPGLGPPIDMLRAMLEERKRKILSTYETETVDDLAEKNFERAAKDCKPPKGLRDRYQKAVQKRQFRDLERLWYAAGDDRSPFARELMQVINRLGEHYQIDELVSKYTFTGRTPMDVPKALEVKEELESIDELLEQLKKAQDTAQLAIVDLEQLSQFAEPGDIEKLQEMQKQIEEYVRNLAEQQGLEKTREGFKLTPQATRLFQGTLLNEIFSDLEAARSGRHSGPILGEGAVEMPQTKPYEFGDSVANMDIPGSLVNAMIRTGGAGGPIRMRTEDIEIHKTRNNPKCATCVLMDMSGSMRYDALYVNVKRMGLALEGLIRSEYPGDYLQFVEIFSFAKPVRSGELVTMMPKIPTLHDPVVRLKVDMSRDDVSEVLVPPHFTNIQRGLQLARTFLAGQDTPNRQIVLITDGLPTAHFEGEILYLLYPPDPRTEEATMREAQLCAKEGITINIFLLPSWSQSREDVQFAYRVAESTKGRVFFAAGKDLDRFVLHDYIHRKKRIMS